MLELRKLKIKKILFFFGNPKIFYEYDNRKTWSKRFNL